MEGGSAWNNESFSASCNTTQYLYNGTDPATGATIASPIVMFLAGLIGNMLALMVLHKTKKEIRNTVFYTLVAALTWNDLIGICLTSPPVLAAYVNGRQMPALPMLCRFHALAMVCFGLSTPFIVCAMALERSLALHCPYFYCRHCTPSAARLLVALLWALVLFFGALPLFNVGSYALQYPKTWCFLNYCPNSSIDKAYAYTYALLNLGVVAVMMVCNVLVISTLCHVRKSRKLSNSSINSIWAIQAGVSTAEDKPRVYLQQKFQHSSRRRPTRNVEMHMIWLLGALTTIFSVCWVPLMVYIIFILQHPNVTAPVFGLVAVRLASLNQTINPWIYVILRKSLLSRLRRLCKKHHRPSQQDLPLHQPYAAQHPTGRPNNYVDMGQELCPSSQHMGQQPCPSSQHMGQEPCPSSQHMGQEPCPSSQHMGQEPCLSSQHLSQQLCPSSQHMSRPSVSGDSRNKRSHLAWSDCITCRVGRQTNSGVSAGIQKTVLSASAFLPSAFGRSYSGLSNVHVLKCTCASQSCPAAVQIRGPIGEDSSLQLCHMQGSQLSLPHQDTDHVREYFSGSHVVPHIRFSVQGRQSCPDLIPRHLSEAGHHGYSYKVSPDSSGMAAPKGPQAALLGPDSEHMTPPLTERKAEESGEHHPETTGHLAIPAYWAGRKSVSSSQSLSSFAEPLSVMPSDRQLDSRGQTSSNYTHGLFHSWSMLCPQNSETFLVVDNSMDVAHFCRTVDDEIVNKDAENAPDFSSAINSLSNASADKPGVDNSGLKHELSTVSIHMTVDDSTKVKAELPKGQADNPGIARPAVNRTCDPQL